MASQFRGQLAIWRNLGHSSLSMRADRILRPNRRMSVIPCLIAAISVGKRSLSRRIVFVQDRVLPLSLHSRTPSPYSISNKRKKSDTGGPGSLLSQVAPLCHHHLNGEMLSFHLPSSTVPLSY